ncbi:UNVERIFIED_CONTAM: hypothetical protein FKN15_017132 [Acipenser sinensis]
MAEDARKLRGWILENAGLEAKSLPIAIQIMWMMDSERWEAYQRKHTPNNLEEGLELVLSYLEAAINETAAQVAGPPAEGECLLSPSPPAEGECLLSPSPPAEGECLLSPSPPAEGEAAQVAGPPAEGECLLSPSPPAEGECLLSPSPPAEGECLLSPYPPAEGECLLVVPPQPKWEEPEHPQPKWEEPECPAPKWEEPERPTPEWEEPERPTPEWEEPERPTPEWEEPERPTPEWEEPERPTPEWGEPERPKPKRGESVHPQPKREESVHPQPKREDPKRGGVGASTALGPKQPAEEECLLVPPPPAEGESLLSPSPPAEDECLLVTLPQPAEDECLLVSLPPPAEGECLLGPRPPAEDECLLSPSPPAEGECLLGPRPPAEDECLLSPSPPAEGECLLGPRPPAEDECLLSPSPPAEGECLLGPRPPAEDECLLSPSPPAEGECLLGPRPPAEDECLLSPSPPAEGECLLGPRPPAEDECLLSPSPPAEGECLLGPRPPAEDECLLSPSPPAEGECLLGPRPPAEDECLLSPSPPAEGECLLGPRPPAEDECLLSPSPPAEGECLLGPRPPAEDECLLSPSPPAEGECLLGPRPPAEDECLLSPSPPAEGECLLGPRPPAEDECLLSPSPPAEGECLLGPRPPAEDECLLVTLPQPAEDECLLVTLPQPAEDECLLVTLPQPAEDECLLVETWLNRVLDTMRSTVRHEMTEAVVAYEEKPREQWLFDYPAQVALTCTQIWWTTEVGISFARLEEGYENAMKEYYKKQVNQLNTLITMLIGQLSSGDRQKIMTICTIDVHARDVVAKMISQKVENSQAFVWLSQLRHRWDDEKKHCLANICDAQFFYSYEYLGNTPRLVITPLTDRCYITLTQSLHLTMSGAPAGPAGTGKTETTKDLGRALGIMVYVFNCSEQMDYKVKSIQDAIRDKKKRFNFMGEEINLFPSVGIFITMNPGYAGRTELPENLKALFRPCAMVVPDFELICEIMLVAEGFIEARLLARKFITLYQLCKELLSKQVVQLEELLAVRHSVFVVGNAGTGKSQVLKSLNKTYQNMKRRPAWADLNPKAVTNDELFGIINPSTREWKDGLFSSIMRDLANVSHDGPKWIVLDGDIDPMWIESLNTVMDDNKVVQLEELLAVRHSVFVVGNAGTGKSQVLKSLNKTYQNMKRRPAWADLNPKAVTNDELFGIINPSTREWKDGLFSSIMRDLANVSHDGPKWIVLDGDIDPMWIESLNTVMDDNKVLTLASNERIPLNPTMRLVFEISHLRTATPATVSRAGILYINPADLGWNPPVSSWIDQREVQSEKANLTILFDKYLPLCLDTLRTRFKKIIPIPEQSMVQMLCYLLECLLTKEHIPPDSPKELYELYFVFAAIWAFGGAMFQDQLVDYRVEFSKWWVTEFKTIKFPSQGTIFDYYIDPETKKFEPWSKMIPKFEFDPDMPLQACLVHTTETIRVRYFMDRLLERKRPVMLVGNAGTGKSVLVGDKLGSLDQEEYMIKNVPFNYYTTSAMLQAKSRAIAIPVDLDSQVNNLFLKSHNIVQKTALSWRMSARNATRRDSVLPVCKDYRNIIERLQDIVSALEDRLRPLVQAELSVLVDVLHRPELLFPENTDARRKCESGGFICKLIKHTKQLLEENEEKLCIKVLQTLREMMTKDRGYGEKLIAFDDEMDVAEGEALRQILVNRYHGNVRPGGRRDSLTNFTSGPRSPGGPSKPTGGGVAGGSGVLSRGEMSLAEVQCHLDKEGASDLVIDLIMNATSDRVFQESILLAIALLEGGNTTIQRSFYCRLTEDKKSEKFFKVFYDRMKLAQQEIKATVTVNTSDLGNKKKDDDSSDRDVPVRKKAKESMEKITEEVREQLLEASSVTKKAFSTYRREADHEEHFASGEGQPSSGDKNKDEWEMSAVIAIMQPILRFLQLLCENHNRDLQVRRAGWDMLLNKAIFLRCQNNKANYNLVCETLQFLDCICGSTTGGLGLLGLYINEKNVALINQTLESLTEYCQGPCHENQNCIATHESNGIDIIIALILNDINPLGKKRMDLVLELKNNASKLLLAIMESRHDSENAERILYNMRPKELVRPFDESAVVEQRGVVEVIKKAYLQGEVEFEDSDDDDDDGKEDEDGEDHAASPRNVGHNIYILAHQLARHNKELQHMLKPGGQNGEGDEALEFYAKHTAQIEIVRHDRTMEQIVFPVPNICEFLTKESKLRVYYSTERDEQGSKINDFFLRSEDLFNEMNWQKKLRAQPVLYWCSRNMSFWSSISFNLAVLMNLLVAFFYPLEGIRGGTLEPRLSALLWVAMFVSLAIVIVLPQPHGIRALIASTILRLIFSVGLEPTLFLLGAFNVCNKVIFLMSFVGNRGTFTRGYLAMILDVEFLYHLLYLIICSLGVFVHVFFYSLLLFDLVYREETLLNVIKSVTRNGRSIVLTAVLALILVYLFSIVGYIFFKDDFILEVDRIPNKTLEGGASLAREFLTSGVCRLENGENCSTQTIEEGCVCLALRTGLVEEDAKERTCESLLMCIVTVLSHGLRSGGGVGDVLRKPSKEEPLFAARVIYDLLFFFMVIIIVLNLIFGVIIDTFADLRSEKQKKEEVLKTTCFICGLERDKFDNKTVTFEEHIKVEHNMWHYLCFIVLVKVKDSTEYTGPESYVAEMIKELNLDWFPRMRAMSLVSSDAEGEQNEIRNLQEKLESTMKLVCNLSGQLTELKDQMTEQRKQKQRLGLLGHPPHMNVNPQQPA